MHILHFGSEHLGLLLQATTAGSLSIHVGQGVTQEDYSVSLITVRDVKSRVIVRLKPQLYILQSHPYTFHPLP